MAGTIIESYSNECDEWRHENFVAIHSGNIITKHRIGSTLRSSIYTRSFGLHSMVISFGQIYIGVAVYSSDKNTRQTVFPQHLQENNVYLGVYLGLVTIHRAPVASRSRLITWDFSGRQLRTTSTNLQNTTFKPVSPFMRTAGRSQN